MGSVKVLSEQENLVDLLRLNEIFNTRDNSNLGNSGIWPTLSNNRHHQLGTPIFSDLPPKEEPVDNFLGLLHPPFLKLVPARRVKGGILDNTTEG
jgi:hypothetical protein